MYRVLKKIKRVVLRATYDRQKAKLIVSFLANKTKQKRSFFYQNKLPIISHIADQKYCKLVQASATFWQSFDTIFTILPAATFDKTNDFLNI